MSDDTWLIRNLCCDPATLAQFNSVCTISNGYLGLKGNLAEDHAGPDPVTLIHGIYDELDMFGLLRPSARERRWLDPAHFDSAGRSPGVANLPDPLLVRVFVGDREVTLRRGRVTNFEQRFDLQAGVYHYTFDYDDGIRTTRIAAWRFAALRHAHRVYMRYRVTPHAHAPLRLLTGIRTRVTAPLTGEVQFGVEEMSSGPNEQCRVRVRTPARGHEVHLSVSNRLAVGSGLTGIRDVLASEAAYTLYDFFAKRGQPITIDRTVCLSSSEDGRHGVRVDPAAEAQAAAAVSFDQALVEQRAAWQELWARADVQIEGDEPAQRYLRFALHHVLAAAPRFSDRLSVPVKLLSGAYYQGNTFYDTDTLIVPVYTFTMPEYARTCLNYRYEGLAPGRQIARAQGCAGAKFAWQAGPYGEECLGPWYRFVHTNIHINGDVAWSLMQYRLATGDESFLRDRGLDLLIEAARFYASRARCEAARDAYDLCDVAGPDEAHCESTNNFYTNYLAIRTLRWAADELERLRAADPVAAEVVALRLDLRADEPRQWRRVAERLPLRFDPATKLYEQCAGFFDLPPPPADLLERRQDWFVPLAQYQALNQPDVLMALALFRDDFPEDVQRANWEYYRRRSMDFSSMSHALNAILAAELGDLAEAYRNFMITAGLDLDESLTGRQDTAAGLHGTALGGAWLAAVWGFGGVSLSERWLRIRPKLPPPWSALRFKLMLRGVPVAVAIERERVSLLAEADGLDLPIRVADQPVALRAGQVQGVPCGAAARPAGG